MDADLCTKRAALGLAAAFLLTLCACATPTRLAAVPAARAADAVALRGGERFLVARGTSDLAAEAIRMRQRELEVRRRSGQPGPLPPAAMLAISGGGDSGAFGAGFLNGWTARGDRPEFKVVTGVSTGALMAPFAFLGPKYDPVLRSLYTGVSQRDIFRARNVVLGFFSDGMTDTTPLFQLVQRHVDRALLDEIAAEYAKGRLLLVGTTNLDTPEPVVWNMTAIAASDDPRALDLFRKILLASSAIPGVFPPVLIDVQVDGRTYQEMHVDGGAMAQVFLYPPGLQAPDQKSGGGGERQRSAYIIRNARLDPTWADVRRRTLPIATRAISALMQTQGVGDLYRIYLTTRRDGVAFNLAYIPPTFSTPHTREFDPVFMRALYQVGYDEAVAGFSWKTAPPGYVETAAPPPAHPAQTALGAR